MILTDQSSEEVVSSNEKDLDSGHWEYVLSKPFGLLTLEQSNLELAAVSLQMLIQYDYKIENFVCGDRTVPCITSLFLFASVSPTL
jgi:hypothetical protein